VISPGAPAMTRILIWSPNYAPEPTGIPPLVTDAAEWLAGRGHDVGVVTGMPNYPERRIARGYRGLARTRERRDGVDVHRSWLRVRPRETFLDKTLYELTFATLSLPHVLRRLGRCDVLVCVVPSLAAAACAGAARRMLRLGRLVVWVQDLVLLAAAVVGGTGASARGAISIARGLERTAVRAADRLVACSPGFRDYLLGLGVDEERLRIVHNWVDASWIVPLQRRVEDGRSRFLYAGNLGYTQGFETLVAAARELDGVAEVDIVGEGNAAAHVRSLAASASNVRVRPPVPRDEFPALLGSADVLLVLQRSAAGGANFPSKIASYLASGRPIIASVSPDTPAAETLRASGAAVLVPPEDAGSLAGAMRRLQREAAVGDELGRRGREFALRTFDRESALERLEAALIG
jgi:colanic acid biosynthesis glycosyl transferase WcaI